MDKLKEVIDKAKLLHNGKYDYSLITEYKGLQEKYPIICHEKDAEGNEHGVFMQDLGHHLYSKRGCPRCAGNARRTTESFIEDATKIHNGFYSYEKAEYKGCGKKVTITYPIHRRF